MNNTEMHIIGRPYATKIAQEIGTLANTLNPEFPAVMAGFLASLVLQNIAITVLMANFTPGSAGGEEALENIYRSALRDAKERWHKEDLKKNAHLFKKEVPQEQ